MEKYFIHKNPIEVQARRHHEIHKKDCLKLPLVDNIDLGMHATFESAIATAKRYYTNVDGCRYCLIEKKA